MAKDVFKDKKLLTHFIRQLCSLPDTPALIQFVAGDEDNLRLCSSIVNASADDSRDLGRLIELCRAQGTDFHVLKEKLAPVTRALGLRLSYAKQIDYYELLGISQTAGTPEIKKAFRQKARGVHPDTSSQGMKSSQEFIHLKTAYQILRDPVLRQQYDQHLLHTDLWREKANKTVIQNRSGRTRIFYQLGGIFLLLIIVVFIFDFLYRQNSIFDNDYINKQEQVIHVKNSKEVVKEDSGSKTGQKSTAVKSLPHDSEDARKIFKPDEFSQKEIQKAKAETPRDVSK